MGGFQVWSKEEKNKSSSLDKDFLTGIKVPPWRVLQAEIYSSFQQVSDIALHPSLLPFNPLRFRKDISYANTDFFF